MQREINREGTKLSGVDTGKRTEEKGWKRTRLIYVIGARARSLGFLFSQPTRQDQMHGPQPTVQCRAHFRFFLPTFCDLFYFSFWPGRSLYIFRTRWAWLQFFFFTATRTSVEQEKRNPLYTVPNRVIPPSHRPNRASDFFFRGPSRDDSDVTRICPYNFTR